MNLRNFFAELKRRNVYKVAVAYAVVGWLVVQVGSTVLPTFHAPEWVVQTLVVLVALGFPIALVIAWAFELTPEGIKRTEAGTETPPVRSGRRVWMFVVLAAGALSVALFLLGRYTASPRAATPATAAKSIAVLPFENRSEDKANAYFADGIQDEILTRLAKIDDLKVISRTSTQRYKSSPENLREIAKQLGVGHVLEGSVQKSGDQVRVNVQLINAETDAHLWAEVYDRKVADIFAVQSEIAETIAKALKLKLSSREKEAVAARPTENPDAYDAYLRGLAIWHSLDLSPKTIQDMGEFYSRAVQLDANFAVAWANLSLVHTLSFAEFDPTAERLAEAKRALDTAFRLQPGLGEAHFALGLYRYRALRDYEGALKAFDDAIDHGVNKALSLEFSSYVKRRQGKWEESLALNDQSQKLDPRNAIIYSERALTLDAMRRYGEARAMVDRALEITPSSPVLLAQKARTFQAEGNFAAAERFTEQIPSDPQRPELIGTLYNQWMCTRRYGDVVRVLEGILATSESLTKSTVAALRVRLGFAKICAGDADGGRRDLVQGREELAGLRDRSDNRAAFLEGLVMADGLLRDRAQVEANIAAIPDEVIRDEFYGPEAEETVACAWAHLGEPDKAIEILQRLLRKPGGPSRGILGAHPIWEPLWSDPRFQELVGAKP
jgi:TolB-like protein/Tfp pilus assembly protein PilF